MSSVFHTCRWCQDHGCLACDHLRAERIASSQRIAEGTRFLKSAANGFSEAVQESLANVKVTEEILYLLGAAVSFGRSEQQALGEHPAGGNSSATKFEFLELRDLEPRELEEVPHA